MNPETAWTVVFCDHEPLPPHGAPRSARLLSWCLERCLRPGFRHVFALRPAVNFTGYLLFNPSSSGLNLLELPVTGLLPLPDAGGLFSPEQWLANLQIAAERGQIHLVRAQAARSLRWRPRGPLTCVAAVKHLLGHHGPELTPHQLYQTLKAKEN